MLIQESVVKQTCYITLGYAFLFKITISKWSEYCWHYLSINVGCYINFNIFTTILKSFTACQHISINKMYKCFWLISFCYCDTLHSNTSWENILNRRGWYSAIMETINTEFTNWNRIWIFKLFNLQNDLTLCEKKPTSKPAQSLITKHHKMEVSGIW